MKRIIFFGLLFSFLGLKAQEQATISGELKKWHKVTLDFVGPEVSESDEFNPFFNYRLNVNFTHSESGKSYMVPGYFAADGDAANSSATSGQVWRVHFAPDEVGVWAYEVQFRKGKWVAVSDRDTPGVSGEFMDGAKGQFMIEASDKTGRDFRAKGRLDYVGGQYLQFQETKDYFLKQGPDAPENFLSYVDFDGTFHNDGHKDHLVKKWEAHLVDWKEGDPTWQGGKGKAIIGAMNYLAEKKLNSVSFLTMNIVGDDQNVFPYVDYDTYDRFDVSKLDQWEILFEHADRLGLFLHFKTMEMENQGLLDHGGVGAYTKLYYRELIARYSHHLALNWNMCEENGDWVKNHKTPPQFKYERLSMAGYFHDHDPYQHHIVIHNGNMFEDILGSNSMYTGLSIQTHHEDFHLVHPWVIEWRNKSVEAGKPWAIAVDEPGDAQHSLMPDKDDPSHDVARKNALWGGMMAGAWGLEWYFGYKHDHSDLTCEDYRSRDAFWDQCVIALDFFNSLPFWEMQPADQLIDNGNYVFAKPGEIYVVYFKTGEKSKLDLSAAQGELEGRWFNPRSGDYLKKTIKVKGGSSVELTGPKKDDDQDWTLLLTKK
ncbi:DUF5060 domain-containing protein [Reichenbachiella ulvae]|uniref:DUF5060 domain-containing protein n=1 Tax=Reichenbachiella ulvae TaxID=2980104 RepID=A0ABT3D066_9BACT|nr:DUF5060 domain-containing protein [Reichenbachiella ulvae]MCV9389287.1 DUF5060 domain-containing protein [Reichenbachiella ulvae]